MRKNIKKNTLVPIVRKLLTISENTDINIHSCRIEEFKEGTQGEVYLVQGVCLYEDNGISKKNNWEVVLKIQKKWDRFGDPESWKREYLMYKNKVFEKLPNCIRVPKCFEIKIENNEVWLWLENLKDSTNKDISIDDYQVIAKSLGKYQAILNMEKYNASYPWMSSRYWYTITLIDWGSIGLLWLDDEKYNENDRELNLNIIENLYYIWNNRDEFLDIMNKLPQTVCHRDFHPANIFINKEDNKETFITLIDWDCVGVGILGEDIADLLGETLTYYDYDVDKANELMDMIYLNYIHGLRKANWRGDEEQVKLGYKLCFVLHWSFRVYSLLKDTEDKKVKERYINIIKFICGRLDDLKNHVNKSK